MPSASSITINNLPPCLLPWRRTALMFAAGNNAQAALEVLLDRGASVSIRDRWAWLP